MHVGESKIARQLVNIKVSHVAVQLVPRHTHFVVVDGKQNNSLVALNEICLAYSIARVEIGMRIQPAFKCLPPGNHALAMTCPENRKFGLHSAKHKPLK